MSREAPLAASGVPAPRLPATTALVFWLLVICGLAGVTFLRLEKPAEVVPLWAGTIVGVALGQLVVSLRIRVWVLAVLALGGMWAGPALLFFTWGFFGEGMDTFLYAFLPAAVCGYLSLTERGALASFWYPAVLWMVVIVDGPSGANAALDVRTSLPFVVGLGALFVVFLRARESRRVEIWKTHGAIRIAPASARTVLRASPLRSASEVVWTGLAGATALVLAAWIAPHLWQKEHALRETSDRVHLAAAQGPPRNDSSQLPCCPDGSAREKRSRVREYFPLVRERVELEQDLAAAMAPCTACRFGQPISYDGEGSVAGGNGGDGAASSGSSGTYAPGYADYAGTGTESAATPAFASPPTPPAPGLASPAVDPAPSPPVAKAPTDHGATSAPHTPPAPAPMPKKASSPPEALGHANAAPPSPTPPAFTHPSQAAPVVLAAGPVAPSTEEASAPWRWTLLSCLAFVLVHVAGRGLRRSLTLRHLARPLWGETMDQRVSNHWQRMLVGLRDAGIRPSAGEQPTAFARRVGLEGMATCAEILERVRHGVRVDAGDLASMDAAATRVFHAARARAGLLGRAAAWLRWPLA